MTECFLQEKVSGKIHRVTLPCVVGRGESADIDFCDPTVSHRHALVLEKDNRIWIQDLKSLNGVYVNEQRIAERAPLEPGDSIRLGQFTFTLCRYCEESPEDTVILHSLQASSDQKLDRQRLRWLYEVTAKVTENQDPTILSERIFSKLKEIYKQDQGYIGLFREDGSLESISSDSSLTTVPVSRSIVNRLLRNGESFILTDALDEESLKKEESVLALRIRSALCAPLLYRNQIYGLIYLSRSVPGAYNHDDLEFLITIAGVLAPLVENARLWAEIKGHYASAMETLKETQSRLIEMERAAAYVWLAQAIAHEIRNPLMVIGGMVRRMAPPAADGVQSAGIQAVMNSVERIEMVLKEVDSFVKLPSPKKKLEKIDALIQAEIDHYSGEWQDISIRPALQVNTSHLAIPLDYDLFRKALSLIFKETFSNVPRGSDLVISVQDCGSELEIAIGQCDDRSGFCEAFDPALQNKPWVLDLFLNMAHKIISEQGGKMLLDCHSRSTFPLIIRMQRIEKH